MFCQYVVEREWYGWTWNFEDLLLSTFKNLLRTFFWVPLKIIWRPLRIILTARACLNIFLGKYCCIVFFSFSLYCLYLSPGRIVKSLHKRHSKRRFKFKVDKQKLSKNLTDSSEFCCASKKLPDILWFIQLFFILFTFFANIGWWESDMVL